MVPAAQDACSTGGDQSTALAILKMIRMTIQAKAPRNADAASPEMAIPEKADRNRKVAISAVISADSSAVRDRRFMMR